MGLEHLHWKRHRPFNNRLPHHCVSALRPLVPFAYEKETCSSSGPLASGPNHVPHAPPDRERRLELVWVPGFKSIRLCAHHELLCHVGLLWVLSNEI
jgi:hypothetical protein